MSKPTYDKIMELVRMDFKITMIVMLKKAKEITHKTLGKVDHFNIELPPVTEEPNGCWMKCSIWYQ